MVDIARLSVYSKIGGDTYSSVGSNWLKIAFEGITSGHRQIKQISPELITVNQINPIVVGHPFFQSSLSIPASSVLGIGTPAPLLGTGVSPADLDKEMANVLR